MPEFGDIDHCPTLRPYYLPPLPAFLLSFLTYLVYFLPLPLGSAAEGAEILLAAYSLACLSFYTLPNNYFLNY